MTDPTHRPSSYTSRIAFKSILRAILRQKFTFLILVIQIAVTLAVISNGLFIIFYRLDAVHQASGVDEVNSFVLTSSGFTPSFNAMESIQSDLPQIRQMPNIVSAVSTYSFPYSGSSEWHDLQTVTGSNQNTVPAASYNLDDHGIDALGLRLIAGENFGPSDILWRTDNNKSLPKMAIITRSVASALFNTQDWSKVVGKTIYVHKKHNLLIKGIVQQLQAPWDPGGHINNSIIYPSVVTRNSSRYFIRAQSGRLDSAISEVEQYLTKSNPNRMIRKVQSLEAIKKQLYGPDIAAISILAVVIIVLTLIAAMGIAGSASFSVLQRHKQIGIRRALGANRSDISLHFLTENILQTTAGVMLGVVLALGLNILLVNQYALPKLPIVHLFNAVIFIYVLGMLAILKPMFKAMGISPAQATKNQ